MVRASVDTSAFAPVQAATARNLAGPGLQVFQDYRSPSIRFSDITDMSRFLCKADGHPRLEFDVPHHEVHVRLADRTGVERVLWDADYDLGGTEVLKATAPAVGGEQPEFQGFCPPGGAPHWFELTVTRGRGSYHHAAMEDFIGSQVLESYTPDHTVLSGCALM